MNHAHESDRSIIEYHWRTFHYIYGHIIEEQLSLPTSNRHINIYDPKIIRTTYELFCASK